MTINNEKTYYCSQKFWWLSVDIDRSQTLSCCAASPENIDIEWLASNPGQLFNSPVLQQERSMMLQNIPVKSCQQNCWNAESQNLPSRRTLMASDKITHENLISAPETLNIILGNDCNMSCVYCCKQYSSSWAADIFKNGPYKVNNNDDRYQINSLDKILVNLSQKQLASSGKRNLILEEIIRLDKSCLRDIAVTGGEPFLNLSLYSIVSSLGHDANIKVWSGLGVDPGRFKKECEKIKRSNLEIVISAENTGALYEFNRHGNTWERFCQNISTLDDLEIKYSFNATISNLTLFGLTDFVKWAADRDISWGVCNDPKFLSPHVIDQITKNNIIDQSPELPDKVKQIIAESFSTIVTPDLSSDLKSFIKEYAGRKSKSLDIFPKHFLDWVSV